MVKVNKQKISDTENLYIKIWSVCLCHATF